MKTLIIFLVVMFFGIATLEYAHEQVHVAIYRSYDIESYVDYFKVITIPESPCPTDNCILAHNINEIIGYPLVVFFILIAMLFYITKFGGEI